MAAIGLVFEYQQRLINRFSAGIALTRINEDAGK